MDRRFVRFSLTAIAVAAWASCALGAPKPFTVADSIESRRLLEWCSTPDDICFSPDGSRYLAIVAKGDVAHDGVAIEFLTGETRSLEAAQPIVAGGFFTRALGNIPLTIWNQLSWVDDARVVAFLGDDGEGRKQVFSLDLERGIRKQLTHHPTEVYRYVVSPAGDRVAYTAFAPRDLSVAQRMREEGYAVPTSRAYDYFDGNIDGWYDFHHQELFVAQVGAAPRKVAFESVLGARNADVFSFSPDGRSVLVNLPCDNVPSEWLQYTNQWLRRTGVPQAQSNPYQSLLSKLYVLDVATRSLKPLWNAPAVPLGGTLHAVWSADGRSVVVGPVFVPVDRADRLGLEGRAAAEVSVIDGSWTTLPLPADALEKSFAPMSWRNGVLELKSSGRVDQTIYLRKRSGSWTAFGSRPAIYSHSAAARVQIQLRQDLNTPASLHAADGKGHDRLLSELNPQLRELELGRVEMVHWKAADGRAWEGLLYYPVHYSSGKRFPLVVQTHGYSRSRFSLIGVEGHPSVFAAQALANRDIAVVQLGLPLRESKPFDWLATPREAPIMVAGIDGIIADLAARGVVDKTKVGISGFSRTGFHVEYAVTHSDFVYAAAIAADNVDNSYVQSVFQDWTLEAEQNNGGEAFGEGLGAWLTEASGFNADRVRTPLRLQVNGGRPSAALTHWEMLTRMRHLQLPVELYIIPRMGQGTHNLQNPKQVLAAAGGAVEWYDFWLNGREDTSPAKADQYERWRQLREQRDAALKVLRRPLLQWQATPVPSK